MSRIWPQGLGPHGVRHGSPIYISPSWALLFEMVILPPKNYWPNVQMTDFDLQQPCPTDHSCLQTLVTIPLQLVRTGTNVCRHEWSVGHGCWRSKSVIWTLGHSILGVKSPFKEKGPRRTNINGTPMPYSMWPQTLGPILDMQQHLPLYKQGVPEYLPRAPQLLVDKEVMFTLND